MFPLPPGLCGTGIRFCLWLTEGLMLTFMAVPLFWHLLSSRKPFPRSVALTTWLEVGGPHVGVRVWALVPPSVYALLHTPRTPSGPAAAWSQAARLSSRVPLRDALPLSRVLCPFVPTELLNSRHSCAVVCVAFVAPHV